MKSGFLLNVIIAQTSSVLKLFTSEDESLLIGRNTFFVLYLGLYLLNVIRRFNIKGNGLPGQGLHEDLHASS